MGTIGVLRNELYLDHWKAQGVLIATSGVFMK
jgi:hypothetical protein